MFVLRQKAFMLLEVLVFLVFFGVVAGAFLKALDFEKLMQKPNTFSLDNVSTCNIITKDCVFLSGDNPSLPFIETPKP